MCKPSISKMAAFGRSRLKHSHRRIILLGVCITAIQYYSTLRVVEKISSELRLSESQSRFGDKPLGIRVKLSPKRDLRLQKGLTKEIRLRGCVCLLSCIQHGISRLGAAVQFQHFFTKPIFPGEIPWAGTLHVAIDTKYRSLFCCRVPTGFIHHSAYHSVRKCNGCLGGDSGDSGDMNNQTLMKTSDRVEICNFGVDFCILVPAEPLLARGTPYRGDQSIIWTYHTANHPVPKCEDCLGGKMNVYYSSGTNWEYSLGELLSSSYLRSPYHYCCIGLAYHWAYHWKSADRLGSNMKKQALLTCPNSVGNNWGELVCIPGTREYSYSHMEPNWTGCTLHVLPYRWKASPHVE